MCSRPHSVLSVVSSSVDPFLQIVEINFGPDCGILDCFPRLPNGKMNSHSLYNMETNTWSLATVPQSTFYTFVLPQRYYAYFYRNWNLKFWECSDARAAVKAVFVLLNHMCALPSAHRDICCHLLVAQLCFEMCLFGVPSTSRYVIAGHALGPHCPCSSYTRVCMDLNTASSFHFCQVVLILEAWQFHIWKDDNGSCLQGL